MLNRPLRVAFVLRSFTFGGAEHDVIQLITQSDPRVMTCVGLAIQMPFALCPDLPLDHPRVARIYYPGGEKTHPKVITRVSFPAAVKRLAAQAEVILAWGVEELAELIPADFRGKVVLTSKASGAFQESFLHPNSLLTPYYVANSRCSVEAYPRPLRHRVEIIYPGIQPERIAQTVSRDRQRARWRLSPDDLVVGYLGRIAPDKGVEPLVEAVASMDRRWKVVLVGLNGNFADYERQFVRYCRQRLPGRARLVRWRTDVGNVLPALDVLAYPTTEEGFANSLAEAWLVGVPTVATTGVGALAEKEWSRCAQRIPADFTPRELAVAIQSALGNERLVERARRRANALTVAATLARWEQYLTGLFKSPQRTRVMVLLPNALLGGIPAWLLTLARHTPLVDWVCLVVMSETPEFQADRGILQELIRQGCPVMGIPPVSDDETRQRLLTAILRTRPDVILQCGVRDLDGRFPRTDIPLVAVSHGAADCEWACAVLANSSRCATHRAAVSRTAVGAFRSEYRRGVRVIANGVELPPAASLRPAARRRVRARWGLSDREIAVGFVGRLSAEKDPLRVARALEHLPRNYRGVFVGPDHGGLLAEIRRVTSRSIHVAPVLPRRIPHLMPGLDVLVCVSHYESFGLAIAEAWAARVPVVSTRVGIVAELIDELDVAVTVPVNPPPKVLAKAIRQAVRERRRRVARCQSLVRERWPAARMGAEWQEYLGSIARRS